MADHSNRLGQPKALLSLKESLFFAGFTPETRISGAGKGIAVLFPFLLLSEQ